MRFELDRLLDYKDEDLIAEIQRAAGLVPGPKLTRTQFDAVAKVASSTLIRRLGGWEAALRAAGIAERYSGRAVTEKMRAQVARMLTNEEVIQEFRRVAEALGTDVVTRSQLNGSSTTITSEVVTRRFGSWKKGVTAAGLKLSNHGRRYTDDEYFENLLAVWTHHARQPKYREMSEAPSAIPGGAYEAKWRRWSLALQAFIERVNTDQAAPPLAPLPAAGPAARAPLSEEDQHAIRIGLRYAVLSRDRFRCVLCGANPASDLACKLHVDHIVPFSKGGRTVLENLRSTCEHCNIGKGAKTI